MRAYLNSILNFIVCSTLTDDEWSVISTGLTNNMSPSLENYTALLSVLQSRETVSQAGQRLQYYFLAANIAVPVLDTGKTNIYIGDAL